MYFMHPPHTAVLRIPPPSNNPTNPTIQQLNHSTICIATCAPLKNHQEKPFVLYDGRFVSHVFNLNKIWTPG